MYFRNWIFALLVSALFATPVLSEEEPPARKFNIQTQATTGVKFITGGVGEAQQAAMERRFATYSFKLVNVRSGGDGAYVSNVNVNLKNAEGKTILQTQTEGPWLIADMEPGSYTVKAKFSGKTQKRDFVLHENSHERMVLKWNTLGE